MSRKKKNKSGKRRSSMPPGGQLDWRIRPTETRAYTLQTFGALDTVMVLF